MRIGIDVDGVLADFNTSFIDRVVKETGRDLFPPRPFDIPCWDYPEHYGYTKLEVSTVWNGIVADAFFWSRLPAYADTQESLDYLLGCRKRGDDLYFITSRPGVRAKAQTEEWLSRYRFGKPTVLISSEKGLCAKALCLDAYIDDRWENCWSVRHEDRGCRTFLLNRPWNRAWLDGAEMPWEPRVDRLVGFAD